MVAPQRIRPFLAAVNHHDLLTLAGLIESGKDHAVGLRRPRDSAPLAG